MGLAASQARLLSLTARQSDNEFRGQQINNRRLTLSSKMDKIATDYSDGMSNTRLVIRQAPGSDQMVAFKANLLATNGLGLVYGDSKNKVLQDTRDTIPDPNDATKTIPNPHKGQYIAAGSAAAPTAYFTDAQIEDKIMLGSVSVAALNPNTGEVVNVIDWRSDTTSTVSQELDETDDKVVAAKYEADSTKVQTADKRLEMELKDLDTQHKAMETEIDAVKKVIDKNIQSSFKTFG
jgi:hypothetical protein